MTTGPDSVVSASTLTLPCKITLPEHPYLFSCRLYQSVAKAWDFDQFRSLRLFPSTLPPSSSPFPRILQHTLLYSPLPVCRATSLSDAPTCVSCSVADTNASLPHITTLIQNPKTSNPSHPTAALSPTQVTRSLPTPSSSLLHPVSFLPLASRLNDGQMVVDRSSHFACNTRPTFRGNTSGSKETLASFNISKGTSNKQISKRPMTRPRPKGKMAGLGMCACLIVYVDMRDVISCRIVVFGDVFARARLHDILDETLENLSEGDSALP